MAQCYGKAVHQLNNVTNKYHPHPCVEGWRLELKCHPFFYLQLWFGGTSLEGWCAPSTLGWNNSIRSLLLTQAKHPTT